MDTSSTYFNSVKMSNLKYFIFILLILSGIGLATEVTLELISKTVNQDFDFTLSSCKQIIGIILCFGGAFALLEDNKQQ